MAGSSKYIAFLKLGAVLLVVACSIVAARYLHERTDKARDEGFLTTAVMNQGKVFFIGSSRTRSSVNDSMLNRMFNRREFVNIGLDNSSFLFNKIVASKLLDHGGPKTIFIELSVLNARLPTGYPLLAGDDVVVRELQPLIGAARIEDFRRIVWPLYEQASISRIRLGPAIKAYQGNTIKTGPIGYAPSADTAIDFAPHTLLDDDSPRDNSTPVHPLYHHLVRDLLLKANRSGSRVIFFISPVLKTEEEKNALVDVFETIHPRYKMAYDPLFLEALYNQRYFKDHTHMNTAGSVLFTRYLAEQMTLHQWVQAP